MKIFSRHILFTLIFTLTLFLSSAVCFAQSGHWEELNPPHNPGGRTSHGMAQIDTNMVLLFGGYNGYDLNDTWLFDLQKNDWEKIECKNSPSPRAGFGMCQISENRVLLFGGSSSGIADYNDLWLFDLDSMDWKELNPLGFNDKYFPQPTYRLGMAKLSDSSIIIYGGEIFDTVKGYTTTTDDTWIYHINQNRWQHGTMQYPQGRSGHMMTDIDSNLVLMTGNNSGQMENWIYRNGNYSWRRIKDFKNNLPLITNSAIAGFGNGIAVLFGGYNGYIIFDSTWLFNYKAKSWINCKLNVHPSNRVRSRMARIDSNKTLLFGGGPTPYLNDTWLFVLDSIPSSVNESQHKSNYISVKQVSSDEIIIEFSLDKPNYFYITIYNIRGEAVFHKGKGIISRGKKQENIRMHNFSSGVYFIKISTSTKIHPYNFICYSILFIFLRGSYYEKSS